MATQEQAEIERAHPAGARRTGNWRMWLKTARPFSLPATVTPILVGSALAAHAGRFDWLIFALTILSGAFLQTGTNFFNEYFDHRYGLDTAQSLGASTVIFTGDLTARQVLAGGLGSFALATALGAALIVHVGPAILLFGLAALVVGYFYSARPFTFAARGLGDPLVYLAMGFLMTWGAYFVQRQAWSWAAFAASVPVGFLVVAILNMNNLRDYPDDLTVHKRTLPVRFGMPFGRWYEVVLVVGAYVVTTAFAFAGLLPLFALVVWLTLPWGLRVVRVALDSTEQRQFRPGMKHISLLHLYFGVALAVGILL